MCQLQNKQQKYRNDWGGELLRVNEQVSKNRYQSTFPELTIHKRSMDNYDDSSAENRLTLDGSTLDVAEDSGSSSFSSSSSDIMSSSVIEGKCCEEHLSLTKEMAVRLLKEYVKNLKDFSAMMRERQSTTVRDISTSPIHSPTLDSSDKHNCTKKRDLQNIDNTSFRQRPSSIFGMSNLYHSAYVNDQQFRPHTPTSIESSTDRIIDIPLASTKKHFFPVSRLLNADTYSYRPNISKTMTSDKFYSTVAKKQPTFTNYDIDSDDSGQRTPINSEPRLHNPVLRSEKHYQLEKDCGFPVPILLSTQPLLQTTDNEEAFGVLKQHSQEKPGKITMLPPQPEIIRSERLHKPNILILEDKPDQEFSNNEMQAETTLWSPKNSTHVRASSDTSKIDSLRRKSPSPSYPSPNISSENSVRPSPPIPTYHSSPTPQMKLYHSGTLRSSSVHRMPSNSQTETLWISSSNDIQQNKSHRSLVKSLSGTPLSGISSNLDSVSPDIASSFSQVGHSDDSINHLTVNSKQTTRNEGNKPSPNDSRSVLKDFKQSSDWSNTLCSQKNDITFADCSMPSFLSPLQHTSTHVTKINQQPRWSLNPRNPVNINLNAEQNGSLNYNGQSSDKTHSESAAPSVSILGEYPVTNKSNRNEPIRRIEEISTPSRRTRACSVIEDALLSSSRLPRKYEFQLASDQVSPNTLPQVYTTKKNHDITSQPTSDNSYPNKSDISTQTDDFYSNSWTDESLDSPNCKEPEASIEAELSSSENEPSLQTWPLSLQSIVRPVDPESISPDSIENNHLSSVNMQIQTGKSSCMLIPTKDNEYKIQPSLAYQKEPWRRHSLRVTPSEPAFPSATQRIVDNVSEKPPQRLPSSRKPRTTSRLSVGNPNEVDAPRCRSVHFSSDVLVAHTGSGPEPLLLSSAPLKESASDDDDLHVSDIFEKKPSHLTRLSIDCGQDVQSFLKPLNTRTRISKPTAPLPYRRQFAFNTENNFDF
ncbi:unnamed protein product [Heterobilharzia americana]|nr:unnamed protein product [Heterobilharzia americana]